MVGPTLDGANDGTGSGGAKWERESVGSAELELAGSCKDNVAQNQLRQWSIKSRLSVTTASSLGAPRNWRNDYGGAESSKLEGGPPLQRDGGPASMSPSGLHAVSVGLYYDSDVLSEKNLMLVGVKTASHALAAYTNDGLQRRLQGAYSRYVRTPGGGLGGGRQGQRQQEQRYAALCEAYGMSRPQPPSVERPTSFVVAGSTKPFRESNASVRTALVS